jgi:hypothetical protein
MIIIHKDDLRISKHFKSMQNRSRHNKRNTESYLKLIWTNIYLEIEANKIKQVDGRKKEPHVNTYLFLDLFYN